MEKNMENEMETGIMQGLWGLGFRIQGLGLRVVTPSTRSSTSRGS